MVLDVGLVVPLDLSKVIQVVRHHSMRLAQALRQRVGQPIHALESRAIAKVEAGHRIEGRTRVSSGGDEVRGAGT